MSVVVSGNITQSAGGNILTFTDTSTGVGTLVSRTLNIYDANGNLLQTINMGASLTTTYNITTDAYFQFVETIVDNTGTYTLTINYLSTVFYQNAFSTATAAVSTYDSDYFGVTSNLSISLGYYTSAFRFFIGGFGVSANNMITQANFFVNTPYYVT
jgi:hypothetical protein